MDLAFEKRFSSGYSFGLAYTLSECRDNTAEHLTTGGSPSRSQNARDLDAWEGPCGYDNRHRFSANFVFELPFAKSSTGVTKALLGDWLVSGIFAARSGRPFTVTQGNNNVGPYHTGLPNRIGDGAGPETVDKWFDPAAFQAVPSGVFGNAGRNILRGPGWKALDLSLQKRLSAGPTSLVFRWDVFNVFNTDELRPAQRGRIERSGGHDHHPVRRPAADAVLAPRPLLAGGTLRPGAEPLRPRPASSMSAPRVGNAPVSWAVYEADRPNPPFASVLDEIASAGYEGTELGPYGYLPTDPRELAKELAMRGLSLGSSFVPLPLEDQIHRERSRSRRRSRWGGCSPPSAWVS